MNDNESLITSDTRRIRAKRQLLLFIMIPLTFELIAFILTIISDVLIPGVGLRASQLLFLINFIFFSLGVFLVITSTARENAAQSLLTTAGLFRMKTQEEVHILRRKEMRREMSSWLASVLLFGQSLTYLILSGLLFLEFNLIYVYLVISIPVLAILVVKERQMAKQLAPIKQTATTTTTASSSLKAMNLHQQAVRLELDLIRGFKGSKLR